MRFIRKEGDKDGHKKGKVFLWLVFLKSMEASPGGGNGIWEIID